MGSLRALTGRSRDAMPAPARALLRRMVLGWGMLTARFRLQPSFIVVGASRAGTTTLFRVLSEHPDVVRPTVSKGIWYFDIHHARGQRWYRGHFPLAWPARRRTGGRARTFESSGYYLFHPLAAERIGRELPGVHIVVMVRDPVERAYSAHRHEFVRGFETEDFETAIALEPERLAGEEDRIRADPTYLSHHHRHHSYLARGRYAPQIQRFIDAVGPEHVHIVDADRLFVDPGELTTLFAGLGLTPWRPHEVGRHNAQARGPMDPALRTRLEEEFADDDRALAALMGRTPHWRRDPRCDD